MSGAVNCGYAHIAQLVNWCFAHNVHNTPEILPVDAHNVHYCVHRCSQWPGNPAGRRGTAGRDVYPTSAPRPRHLSLTGSHVRRRDPMSRRRTTFAPSSSLSAAKRRVLHGSAAATCHHPQRVDIAEGGFHVRIPPCSGAFSHCLSIFTGADRPRLAPLASS